MKPRAQEFLTHIIRPTLKRIAMQSDAAEILLLGTCAQESGLLRYWKQINGPALGPYQMEPDTLLWLWDGYLAKKPVLMASVSEFVIDTEDLMEQVVWNLALSTALARVNYWRDPEPLPEADNLPALAAYWKRAWNSEKGKGTVQQWLMNYRNLVED